MREKDFVEQNKEKWGRFEQIAKGSSKADPNEVSDLYNHITNDLSYARSYYNKRSIRVYLNQLSKTVYLSIYRQRKGRWATVAGFWTEGLPKALYTARRELDISFIFFAVSMVIGIFSSMHDPEFARVVLGNQYIDMTEENISQGKPMAVYESFEEFDGFFAITLNNLLVAFRTYVLGAFLGIGTLIIMLYNGIMVGTFQYFFIERGLFQESFLTIWMHGALEISAIVIAGGAGLTMGRGLLFPGTLPRSQAFQIGARRSIKIMLGLVPVFIVAGFIEGFFTRLTELPDIFRGAFIVSCFTLVGLYFWVYPRFKFAGKNVPEYEPDQLIPYLDQDLDVRLLRKTKEVFTATFIAYRKLFGKLIGLALLAAIIYIPLFYFLNGKDGVDLIEFRKFSLYNLFQFHSYESFPRIFYLNLLLISALVYAQYLLFLRTFTEKSKRKIKVVDWVKPIVIIGLFELAVLTGSAWAIALAIIALPFLFFWLAVSLAEGTGLPQSFARMLQLLKGTKRHIFLTFSSLGLIALLLLFLFDSPFTWLYVELVQMNIDGDEEFKATVALLVLLFITQLATFIVIPLLAFGQIIEYFSAVEALEANELEERVREIGIKRSAYGLERE